MGCKLSTEATDIPNEQEREEDPNTSFPSGTGSTVNPTTRKEALGENRVWNILQRTMKEVKYIEPVKEEESPEIDKRQLEELIKQSSPKHGISQVFWVMITERAFTAGALKNIIVLSKVEKENLLIIRVFSVKPDSIDFEFLNKVEAVDRDIFDKFYHREKFVFDVDRRELQKYQGRTKLMKICLDSSSKKPKEIKTVFIRPKISWINKIRLFKNYEIFGDNLTNSRAYFHEFEHFNTIKARIGSENIFPQNLYSDYQGEILVIGDIRKSSIGSNQLLRMVLWTNIDLLALIDRKWLEFKERGFVPINNLNKTPHKTFQQMTASGFFYFLTYDREFALVYIVNTRLRKVMKYYLVTAGELASAYYEIYKGDPYAPGIRGFANEMDFKSKISYDSFKVEDVCFETESQSVIIRLKTKLFVRVNLARRGLSQKYEFFNVLLFDYHSIDCNENNLSYLYRLKLSRLYERVFDNRGKDRLQICPLNTNLDEGGHFLDEDLTLIVSNQQAIIIAKGEEGDIIPVDGMNFDSDFKIFSRFHFERVRDKEGGFDSNIIYYSGPDSTTVVKFTQKEAKNCPVVKSQKLNLSAFMDHQLDLYFVTPIKTSFFQKSDDSLLIFSLYKQNSLNQINLMMLHLDPENLLIQDLANTYLCPNFYKTTEWWPRNDFLLVYVPVPMDDREMSALKYAELQLLDCGDLDLLDKFKLNFGLGFAKFKVTMPFFSADDTLLTFEMIERSTMVVKRWEIKEGVRFEKKEKELILRDCEPIRSYKSDRGVCFLSRNGGDEVDDREAGMVDCTLYTFDMDLEAGVVADLGFLSLERISRIEFISKNEVYLFERDGSPWISITRSGAGEENQDPIVTPISYKSE